MEESPQEQVKSFQCLESLVTGNGSCTEEGKRSTDDEKQPDWSKEEAYEMLCVECGDL